MVTLHLLYSWVWCYSWVWMSLNTIQEFEFEFEYKSRIRIAFIVCRWHPRLSLEHKSPLFHSSQLVSLLCWKALRSERLCVWNEGLSTSSCWPGSQHPLYPEHVKLPAILCFGVSRVFLYCGIRAEKLTLLFTGMIKTENIFIDIFFLLFFKTANIFID